MIQDTAWPGSIAIWTERHPDQKAHEYIIDRMARCDTSGSADKAGAMKDLWGDMAKKMVTMGLFKAAVAGLG